MIKPYFHRTPFWFKNLFSNQCIWEGNETAVYLTFDDGPIPQVTPWVLKSLEKYNAKATFFMVGDNVRKYPEIVKEVLDAGHSIGNHTYHHIDAWKFSTEEYLQNIMLCQNELEKNFVNTHLFRPPYGKLTRKVQKSINDRWKTVQWSFLTGDFDQQLEPKDCTKSVLSYVISKDIVVFHDSLKASPRLFDALPKLLEKLHDSQIQMKSLGYLMEI